MSHTPLKSEVILQLGAEGGTISLYGKEHKGKWYFFSQTNETILLDFLDDEELSQHLINRSSFVKGILNGLRLLDKYPWTRLTPVKLHPSFAEEIISEVKRRIPNDKGRLRRWEKAFESSQLRR